MFLGTGLSIEAARTAVSYAFDTLDATHPLQATTLIIRSPDSYF